MGRGPPGAVSESSVNVHESVSVHCTTSRSNVCRFWRKAQHLAPPQRQCRTHPRIRRALASSTVPDVQRTFGSSFRLHHRGCVRGGNVRRDLVVAVGCAGTHAQSAEGSQRASTLLPRARRSRGNCESNSIHEQPEAPGPSDRPKIRYHRYSTFTLTFSLSRV